MRKVNVNVQAPQHALSQTATASFVRFMTADEKITYKKLVEPELADNGKIIREAMADLEESIDESVIEFIIDSFNKLDSEEWAILQVEDNFPGIQCEVDVILGIEKNQIAVPQSMFTFVD